MAELAKTIIKIKDFCTLQDRDSLFDLAPGEYRAWACTYDEDPEYLYETRILVFEDPNLDVDTGKQFFPNVYVREDDGKFRDLSQHPGSARMIYAVQKIS